MRFKHLAFVVVCSLSIARFFAQDTLQAYRVTKSAIAIDGNLSEASWQQATHIQHFTQRELDFGKPVSEKTEVAVLYDKNNLYIGVWCYQKEPSGIVAKNMNRDFNFHSDDNFQIMISPYEDNRTGYLFVVNPNAAIADSQIYGGEDANPDWNGVWNAKTSQTAAGWFAEIVIPFSTLQFKNGKQLRWAINFERDIVSKNEQALWCGWSRDNSILSVPKAGKLTGISNIAYAKKFELKPYLLGGASYNRELATNYPLKIGGDLNVSLTPTLKLNLTSYTDFAQVESDKIPVNLSRFSIFYPEKRPFFLEGSNMFSFYLGHRSTAFYTREIGVENGVQVPIIAGARLFGKIGKHNLGMLNIQEGKTAQSFATNNSVIRYKYELGSQSYIGGIFTNKYNANVSNQVTGIDAAYKTSHFLQDKNLIIGAKLANSATNFHPDKEAWVYGIYLDYPNDLIDNFMAFSSIYKNFNPELGFLRRKNFDSYSWYLRIAPRWFTDLGVKRMLFKPWGFTWLNTHDSGVFESFHNETRPLGAVFKSGERFECNIIQEYDRIDETFYITEDMYIPAGKYWMYQYEIQLASYQARRLWTELSYAWGDFYQGNKRSFQANMGFNVNKHLNMNTEYIYNRVYLNAHKVRTNDWSLYINYAFTTKLNLSLFAQYNDLEQVNIANFRLHWIPELGSDVFFVFKTGYDEPLKAVEWLKPTSTDAMAKFVYRIVF